MESLRCLRVAPLAVLVAAGALGAGGPVSIAAGTRAWDPPACPGAAAGPPGPVPAAGYPHDPGLDATGTLVGQRLTTGAAGGPERRLDLAAESFASGPVGGLVLTGEDDGTVSRLRLVDPGLGCATTVAGAETAVIRSAVLAPGGSVLFEHRVDRATREDLGVWRRPLGARGSEPAQAVRVLEGLPPDPALGRTFVTDLVAGTDGRIVVSSCAERACRVRILEPGTRRVSRFEGTGPALGVAGSRLVVRSACPGLPCPVEAVDLTSGRHETLVDAAGEAVLGGPDGADVVFERTDGRVGTVNAVTGRPGIAPDTGSTPVRTGSTATAGLDVPSGLVAVAPGRRPGSGPLYALDPTTGRVQVVREVSR
jgi:hypothetical protein